MLVIAGAKLADGRQCDVRINRETGLIDAVGTDLDGHITIDAAGHRLLPGMIDAHVHFREPGAPQKETWQSGSRAAARGGVTTVIDQPNTSPPTVTGAAFDQKAAKAAESLVDFGINGGVTPDWEPDSLLDRPLCAVGEVFLADSTGELGIELELFTTALERIAKSERLVTVHAEAADHFDASAKKRSDADAWSAYRTAEAEQVGIDRAITASDGVDVSLHIAHASTPEGIDNAVGAGASCEVCPHHLFLSREDLEDLGTYGRMNPPLRNEMRRRKVFDRVVDGTVDMIATDHAPHTKAEKDTTIWDAPSGVPGVETALPLLLAEVTSGPLTWERVQNLTARAPARIFDLARKGHIEAGYDADLVLIDPEAQSEIQASELYTKCNWTPFEGWTGLFPAWTMLRGQIIYAREPATLPDPVEPPGKFAETSTGQNVRL